MKVIVSHTNIDFDGLACLLAAKKLYPDAIVALTEKQQATVKSYLAIYRDTLNFFDYGKIRWSDVNTIILVDVASLKRTGIPIDELSPSVQTIIYDHHSPKEGDIMTGERYVEAVGAAVTLLVEQLLKKNIDITPFEATLFGLGLYTDTGNFTFPQVTSRDLAVASALLDYGMDVTLIDQFSEKMLSSEEKQLLHALLQNGKELYIDGMTIFLTTYELDKYQGGLALLTRKIIETTDVDAAISVVKMKKDVHVVTRAQSTRIDFRPLVESLGGGGHKQAASATIKRANREKIVTYIEKNVERIITTAVTARTLMASPVKYVQPTDKIEDVLEQMFQFGHTGFPVVDDGKLVGVISRRDVDKATHHGLGHAPVKAYMSTDPITLPPHATLEEIQSTMMTHNIGRIPIVEDGKMIGILTRTNVIEQLHKQSKSMDEEEMTKEKMIDKMKSLLPQETYQLLKEIGEIADRHHLHIYLIGGIVRDFFLHRPNEDIDIVVEGDGIAFATLLKETLGGEVITHEAFRTATWTINDINIDIVTCRTEYYEAPGQLPTVVASNIREDLRRRDFTINAIALRINKSNFGEVLDFFQGEKDIKEKKIRILHTLSFIEDPTRIFRAVRFALRFNYELAAQTEKLAIDAASMLKQISPERIYRELHFIFAEGFFLNGLKKLDELGVWNALFGISPSKKTWEKVRRFVIHGMKDPFTIFTLFLYGHDKWEEKLAPFILTADQRKLMEQLKQLHSTNIDQHVSTGQLHEALATYSDDILFVYSVLTDKEFINQYVQKRKELKPLLNGHDLIQLQLKPGPHFKTLLTKVASLQLENKITTKKEAIEWIKNEGNKS